MSTMNEKPSPEQVFNVSEALKMIDGDMDLFQEIVVIFLEDYPNQLKKIRDGIARAEATTVERAAHNLKGSVSNFGAWLAFEAAYRLEHMGKEGRLGQAKGALSELEKELKQLEDLLKEALRGMRSEGSDR